MTGSRTANAIYPRSELRETYSDGTLRNWQYSAADNILRASLTVNQVPSTGKIVIGQIHNKDSNNPMVKLEYQYKTSASTGNIVAKVRMRPDDEEGQVITIATGVPLDRNFSYQIHSARRAHWASAQQETTGEPPSTRAGRPNHFISKQGRMCRTTPAIPPRAQE